MTRERPRPRRHTAREVRRLRCGSAGARARRPADSRRPLV